MSNGILSLLLKFEFKIGDKNGL